MTTKEKIVKSFYEMIRILNESKGMNESDDYGAGAYYDDPDISFTAILGEDEDEPFSVEVEIENGYWGVKGGFWAKGYVPNGSENPASRPVARTAGQKDKFGTADNTGTEFENPGRKLELLPDSIRGAAIEWVDNEVKRKVDKYEPDDPRDYADRDDYNPDPDGHRYWDDYWRYGPGRDR